MEERERLKEEFFQILGEIKEYAKKKLKKASPRREKLLELYHRIKDCKRCELFHTRTKFVFGRGNPEARIFFVGEAPGRGEDLQGKPFVGQAGKLLEETIRKVEIPPKEIFIGNIIKCRPPGNRDPLPEEIEKCLPYLLEQIEIIKPRIICTLGRHALKALLGKGGILKLRGKVFPFKEGILVLPTFHPAACLYRPPLKRGFEEDLKKLKKLLEEE